MKKSLILIGTFVEILSIFIHGFVFWLFWKIFIVTSFSLPELGFAAAIGVSLTIKVATSKSMRFYFQDTADDEEEHLTSLLKLLIENLIYAFITPGLFLVVGGIVYLFI